MKITTSKIDKNKPQRKVTAAIETDTKYFAEQVDPMYQQSQLMDNWESEVDYFAPKLCVISKDFGEIKNDLYEMAEKFLTEFYYDPEYAVTDDYEEDYNKQLNDDGIYPAHILSARDVDKLESMGSDAGNTDDIAEVMSILSGDNWVAETIRGSVQSEVATIIYDNSKMSRDDINFFEIEYFNLGSEWKIYIDGVYDFNHYCYAQTNDPDEIIDELCKDIGGTPNQWSIEFAY